MARIRLTAGRVREFTCERSKPQAFLWDTEAPGLAVRVTANGAKAYIFQGKLKRQTIRITIGDVKTWAIEAGDTTRNGAREEARRLQGLIDQKIDPRQQEADRLAAAEAKKAEEEATRQSADEETKRQTVTMREAWKAYIEAMREAKKEGKPIWCPRYLADHEYVVAGKNRPAPLASLVSLRLVELTPERITDWLKEEASKRPTSANIAFRKLRAFIGWCEDQKAYAGLVAGNACTTKDVTNALPTQKAKGDSLQREQLPLWFAEVEKLPLVVSAYLRTLLLTGARREELASLSWDNVDFKWSSLTIKDKVDGQRIIPLTPYVSAMLTKLKRANDTPKVRKIKGEEEPPEWKPSPWVFFSPTAKSGRIEGPHVAHQKALTAAGLPHVSLHGLRRSFKSLAEWVEMPVGVVAQVMGHKQSATAEKHYTVRPLDLLRLWHSRYELWMLEQAGIKFKQAGKRTKTALREVA
jgi:integrase